ncbi:MAG: guanylate kinase [Candidatus Omnitrophica bacterium]|nr:guanylate kinase [Candidatus Omnitrophota bacterium]
MKTEKGRKKKGAIFVISGPSGSGKTTLLRNVLLDKKLKKRLVRSISVTTRGKRSGEKEGKDYFFVTGPEFKKRLKEKKILEWTRYLGYYYGTPREFVEKQLERSKGVLLCLDIKGALRIKRLYPDCTVTIFVLPYSVDMLAERIRQRCSKTKTEEIQKRVKLASRELRSSNIYDYSLVNKDLDKAIKELKNIIIKALKN